MNERPVVLVVMDGVGLSEEKRGNAVANAYTPHLDHLMATCPWTAIKAHGVSVGLPSDADMGNSEVGHNALGCGQIYSQGAKLVNESIESGRIFTSQTWQELVANARGHTFHFIGLLSDGNVHSHINHLKAMLTELKIEGIHRVRLHVLMDGRDVPETSGLQYIDDIERHMAELNDEQFDARIASGGGRMSITMDRYEANWGMVEKGWHTHVLGEGRAFASAREAIETYRRELHCSDQDLPEFVITEQGKPVGTIEDHDSVVLFNFRGDRAIELSRAFDEENFTHFDRVRVPQVIYAGMLQYDADLKIPRRYLTEPPHIEHTLSEFLVAHGLKSYAISETQKFGHVTYFWNGNRSEKFDESLETWVEIPSDIVPFEQRPWMKSAEITDALVQAIESREYQFYRCNYPNGDMVGHTGNYQSTILGVEAVDIALGRVIEACRKTGAMLLVTADHGNADEMFEKSKDPAAPPKPKTSHTLNKVPFILYGADATLKPGDFGLSNVAATVVELLGLQAPGQWNQSMLQPK